MTTFQFKDPPKNYGTDILVTSAFDFKMAASYADKNELWVSKRPDFKNISGAPLPEKVVDHFRKTNFNSNYDKFHHEVTSLSDYNKSFPENKLSEEDLNKLKSEGLAVEVKSFFGAKETYILTNNLDEHAKLIESKVWKTFEEFAKPFIAHDPSLAKQPKVSDACEKIMANYIDNQPNFLKSENFKPIHLFLRDHELTSYVTSIAGKQIAYDLGLNPYDLGLSPEARREGKTSTHTHLDKQEYVLNQQDEAKTFAKIKADLESRGATPEIAAKMVNLIIKEAHEQRKNFELQYNEQRREFDKSQPFKNSAFDIVDKLGDKFNQAVQGLKKVWQVVTTKNLAIEQSKDKQQTVQPQKNTPEVKQQSKAKDMER